MRGGLVLEGVRLTGNTVGRSGSPGRRSSAHPSDSGSSAEGITAHFGPGVHLIIGRNGAGKSTLLRVLATVERPIAGQICFWGRWIAPGDRPFLSILGYLPQPLRLPEESSVAEHLGFLGEMKGMDREEIIQSLGELERELFSDSRQGGSASLLPRRVGELSTGERQLVGIAQAVMARPALLLLDEPFSGLDVLQRQRMGQVIRSVAAGRWVRRAGYRAAGGATLATTKGAPPPVILVTAPAASDVDWIGGHLWRLEDGHLVDGELADGGVWRDRQ